jgi:hypothetical protein
MGSREPVELTPGEVGELSRILWRIGERDGLTCPIALSTQLLEARSDGGRVVVDERHLPALREALDRLHQFAALQGNLERLSNTI